MSIENDFKYHPPKTDEIAQLHEYMRAMCKHVAEEMTTLCPDSRERSLAITKLEEAMMWANAAIARNN